MMSGDALQRGIVLRRRCRGRGFVHRGVAAERGMRHAGRESLEWKVARPCWMASALVELGRERRRARCCDLRVSTWRHAGVGSRVLLYASRWLMWTSLRALVKMGVRVLVSRLHLYLCWMIGRLRRGLAGGY